MSDTIPLQAWDAMLELLNADRTEGIPEFTLCSLDEIDGKTQLPWGSLYPDEEAVKPAGNRSDADVVDRPFTFYVETRAKGSRSVSPLRELEPLRAWVVSRLAGAKLGGLVERIFEVGTRWGVDNKVDPPHAVARHYFRCEVPTLINDLTTRPGRPS